MKKIDLLQKGWSEREIKRASLVLETPRHHDVHFSKIVFWSALIIIIFANLLVSLILIPFLTVLNKWVLYAIVILLAGTIGFLYNFLITDIGHLEKKHHLFASIIIPLIALANVVLMIFISNRLIMELKINNQTHDYWTISFVFIAAFVLPSILSRIRLHFRKRRKTVVP